MHVSKRLLWALMSAAFAALTAMLSKLGLLQLSLHRILNVVAGRWISPASPVEDVFMEYDSDLQLRTDEIIRAFAGDDPASMYPPILTMAQAAALTQVPLGALRDWRSRGLLAGCSFRRG